MNLNLKKLRYYRSLISDKRTPRISKILLIISIYYLLSPIDLIPDFIPVLGQIDDIIIITLLAGIALYLVPENLKNEIRSAVTT